MQSHPLTLRALPTMAAQLSSVNVTRGVALKAPRVAARKARVATRVQAVRPMTVPRSPD